MKAIKASRSTGIYHGTYMQPCDNSGAKIVKVTSIHGGGSKTVRRRKPSAGIADLVNVVVIKGTPEMRKTIVPAIIVRQKKPYKRADGSRIKFEDNSVILLKDEKGNPKGTIFKGPIAKEATERWAPIAKIAAIVV